MPAHVPQPVPVYAILDLEVEGWWYQVRQVATEHRN